MGGRTHLVGPGGALRDNREAEVWCGGGRIPALDYTALPPPPRPQHPAAGQARPAQGPASPVLQPQTPEPFGCGSCLSAHAPKVPGHPRAWALRNPPPPLPCRVWKGLPSPWAAWENAPPMSGEWGWLPPSKCSPHLSSSSGSQGRALGLSRVWGPCLALPLTVVGS